MRSRETEVEVFGGEVESLTTSVVEGVGVRVIADHRQGYAWVGSLDPAVVEEALHEARDNATFGEPDEWYALAGPADVDGVHAPVLDLWRDELASVPTDQKVQIAIDLDRATKAADPRIRNVESSSYGDSLTEAALANSLGVEAAHRRTTCSASSEAIADDGTGAQTGYGFVAGRTLADLDLDSVPRDAATRACRLLGAKPIAGRRIPVILDPLVTRSVLGVLSSAFNGESVLKGRSLFAGRTGEQIGAPGVTVIDDPTDARFLGAATHDSEGVPTRATTLIDAGVLQGFLQNVYTGRRSGAGTTGSAVRGYTSTPGVGVRALRLVPGDAHARADHGVGSRSALRAVDERSALRHEPDQRRLLGRRRGAHGARRRVRRTRARGHGRVDAAAHAARPRRHRLRSHVPARRGRGHDRVVERDDAQRRVAVVRTPRRSRIASRWRSASHGFSPKCTASMPYARAAATLSALSSTNTASVGAMPMRCARELVDLALGLAHPDVARVDDLLEQLVEREHRAPVLAELLHVVGEQAEPDAAVLELADLVHDHPVHAGRALPPEAAVRVHVDLGAEDRGRAFGEPGEVRRDVDLPLLEQVPVGLVERRRPRLPRRRDRSRSTRRPRGDRAPFHADVVRLAEQELEQRSLRVALGFLEVADADEQRARDDAAEVEDHGADHSRECTGSARAAGQRPASRAAGRLRWRDREGEIGRRRRERDHARLGVGDEQRHARVRVVVARVVAGAVDGEHPRAARHDDGGVARALDADHARIERREHVDDRAERRPEAVLRGDVHGAVADRDHAVEPGAVRPARRCPRTRSRRGTTARRRRARSRAPDR